MAATRISPTQFVAPSIWPRRESSISASWFQWCDQDLTGRGNDGENYNCGLVDVTDRPYPLLVEAVSETARRLYRIHSGTLDPVDQAPGRARGHHAIPDLWNK